MKPNCQQYKWQRELPLWRPAGNVDPLSLTASLRTFGRYVFLTSKLTIAENSQPTKQYTPIEDSKPIGVRNPTQFAIFIGEKAKVDAFTSRGLSGIWRQENSWWQFNDHHSGPTQVSFPPWCDIGCQHGHSRKIQEPLERVHAYQHIRKALKNAIPLLKVSAIAS